MRTDQENTLHSDDSFTLRKCLEILERTPTVLKTLLADLSGDWTASTSDHEVGIHQIMHYLILNEEDTWLPNIKTILDGHRPSLLGLYEKLMPPEEVPDKAINSLLKEFKFLRELNLAEIRRLQIQLSNLNVTEDFSIWGKLSVKELMASWMVHDLSHIAKISRIMANRYETEVGKWSQHLDILKY